MKIQRVMGWVFALQLIPAVAALGAEFRRAEDLTLRGKFSDLLFAAGDRVTADIDTTDDVFIAGGEVSYRGRGRESLFLAGRALRLQGSRARNATIAGSEVSIVGAQFRDLILAGADVRMDGTRVLDDLVLTGRNVRIMGGAIGSSVTLRGGEISFGSTVSGDSDFNGRDVTLSGQFTGNVRVNAGRLRIAPETVINGNLVHSVDRIEIAPGAQIRGQTVDAGVWDRPFWVGPFRTYGFLFALLLMLGGLLIAPIVATFFPGVVDRGRDQIRAHFWESLGVGTLTALLLPVLFTFVLATLVGAPIAVAALPFLVVAGILAWTIMMLTIGDQVRRWTRPGEASVPIRTAKQRFGWTFGGAMVVAAILAIPFLGAFFWLVAVLEGIGALLLGSRKRESRKEAQPVDRAA